jgi:hypothetical protein
MADKLKTLLGQFEQREKKNQVRSYSLLPFHVP